MFRIWGKIWQDNHLLSDCTYEEDSDDTRTHKVFRGIEYFMTEFNLQKPIWLDANIKEFQRCGRTKFRQDSFIEEISFDFLEIHIIEDD